jgi:hypothetical protein
MSVAIVLDSPADMPTASKARAMKASSLAAGTRIAAEVSATVFLSLIDSDRAAGPGET